MNQLSRISQQPEVMGGKAWLRGIAVTLGMARLVARLVLPDWCCQTGRQLDAGHGIKEILADCPYLEHEDILQAVRCRMAC